MTLLFEHLLFIIIVSCFIK